MSSRKNLLFLHSLFFLQYPSLHFHFLYCIKYLSSLQSETLKWLMFLPDTFYENPISELFWLNPNRFCLCANRVTLPINMIWNFQHQYFNDGHKFPNQGDTYIFSQVTQEIPYWVRLRSRGYILTKSGAKSLQLPIIGYISNIFWK